MHYVSHSYTDKCMQWAVAIQKPSRMAGTIFMAQPVTRITTKSRTNAAGELRSSEKATGLEEIDISICSIFPKINHDLL